MWGAKGAKLSNVTNLNTLGRPRCDSLGVARFPVLDDSFLSYSGLLSP